LGFAEVHLDRFINYKKNVYDDQWNTIDFQWGAKHGDDVKKPEMLNKMISVAETLAEDFRYVRVDLYNLDGKIYFGELTFSPGGGFCPFNPSDWDRKFGDKLIINNPI